MLAISMYELLSCGMYGQRASEEDHQSGIPSALDSADCMLRSIVPFGGYDAEWMHGGNTHAS